MQIIGFIKNEIKRKIEAIVDEFMAEPYSFMQW